MNRAARPLAILFDIDGTILHTGGAGSRALRRAFVERHGIEDATAGIRFAGNTDPRIIRDSLAAHGHPDAESRAEFDALVALYEGFLEDELATSPRGVVFPGIEALLPQLASLSGVHLGLLTGNVAAGARLKLGHYGLWDHFTFGAFGDDAESRPALLPVALERAAAATGGRFGPADAVVVGDTPHDVEVARVHGARVVAVATGTFDVAELEAAGADEVFEDFADVARAVTAIAGELATGSVAG